MSTDPIAIACRLLREGAAELKNCHTLAATGHDWTGEPEAKAAYDEHMAAADALESWADSIGAGGVESLRGRQCLHRISEPAGEYPPLPGRTVDELTESQHESAIAAYRAAHGNDPDIGFAPDRSWLEGAAYADATCAMRAAQHAGAQEPGAAYAEMPDESYGSIMGAAYDFRDAHISGSMNLKRSAHAALETAVRNAISASHGQAPAGAGMGHTDGGRNMFYEGRFDGESQREQQARLRWANDMRAAFERHTGNGWFDKDWRTETGLWSSAWHACLAAQPTTTAQAAPTCKDSTPELHIGDSAFESWYSTYSPAHKSDKQRVRDAYAAGMGDPLVTAAPAAVAGPWSLGDIEGNWRDIDHKNHQGVIRIVWKMENDERTLDCEALALAVVDALNAAQPAPQQSGVGNGGFDHKTATDFLTGKTVSDEAMRKFVTASRWTYDDRAGLQETLLSVRHELASREAEIALLKTALMNAEAAAKQ